MSNKLNEDFHSFIIQQLLRNRAFSLGMIIVILAIVTALFSDIFTSSENIHAIIINLSEDAIVATGMMLLLISGVFDLSVGAVLGFAGALVANLMNIQGLQPWISIVIAFFACLGIGLINGLLISKIGVNPLIVTLAMMGVVRGLTLVLVSGSGISHLPDGFLSITDNSIFGISMPILYMLIIVGLFTVLLWRSPFFRRYYYIGGNEKAAGLTGINVPQMRIYSFVISAGLAGMAGLIMTSRLSASIPTLGEGLELRSITACILGGGSLLGGVGSIIGAFLGTLFVAIINNLMVITRASTSFQSIIIGGILLLAVTIDAVLQRGNPE